MNSNNLYRILVVDDEETLCEALRYNLEAEGFTVDVAYSAEEALSLPLQSYSLILLDIMMGAISGMQFAEIIKSRADTTAIPVIFCTAKDAEDDMIKGLDLGADDYITKPYSVRNVLARVRTVLRRAGGESHIGSSVLSYRGVSLDTNSKLCKVDSEEIRLPRKEYELLQFFLENRGVIFSRDELLKRVWSDDVYVIDRVIDVHINRLRRKLGPYGRQIVTRSGYGYGFIE
ncbi:response regulator transcription factor [Paramuribaculum intestinale]|jgi:two-component system phosphate regulon response regulator PhoB|uniref:response regulator transcription factor n=1 Tax=Paramuribaculum intestinale TaxID=2094151 RepID=UPI00272B77E6|nr:response regulator transcription factor [Paramuribaculum intestinale]